MVEARTQGVRFEDIREALDFTTDVLHGSLVGAGSFASLEALGQDPREFVEEETESWLASGRLSLYRPRQGAAADHAARLLMLSSLMADRYRGQSPRWEGEFAEDFDADQRAADTVLEKVADRIGSARTILIDRDGQGWDLAEDRLFVCPERVYLDLYNRSVLETDYPLPVPPTEIWRWDWENLLGTQRWRDISADMGLRDPLKERQELRKEFLRGVFSAAGRDPGSIIDEPWLEAEPVKGRILRWSSGDWQDRETRFLLADAQGGAGDDSSPSRRESVMSEAIWLALQARSWGEAYVKGEEGRPSRPGTTEAMIVKGVFPFCALELLKDVSEAALVFRCRSCQKLGSLLPRQHRDRLCDPCRAVARRNKNRLYSARRRATVS